MHFTPPYHSKFACTASMQAALRILGYNDTHHGFMIVDEPGQPLYGEKLPIPSLVVPDAHLIEPFLTEH